MQPMPALSSPASTNSVFIVTIRRASASEPEAYYMPAPNAAVAELRVRRLAKASDGRWPLTR
jgi:hypothetical protein